MSITCKFQLSRSSNVYYSGEEIAGSITIYSLKQCQIEEIILEFYGQSTVQWPEVDKTKENIMHNDVSTHEVCVTNKALCYEQQKHVCEQLKLDSSNCKQLQPHVEYTFNFCIAIAQPIPATYRCRYGQTDYGLRLHIERPKKVNKEFHQRIVVKNKLDLTQGVAYKEPCIAYRCNKFGQINLQIPCSGFTPGQKIPYYLRCHTIQNDCKVLIQLKCYTTCRLQSNCNKLKQIKQVVNYEKHLSTEISSFVNIPLHCHISNINNAALILSTQYTLEAFLVNNKKVLLSAAIPLTIGSTPCYTFIGGLQSYMCFDNFGSSTNQLSGHQNDIKIANFSHSLSDQHLESFSNLNIKSKLYLRRSLKYYYRKLIKFV